MEQAKEISLEERFTDLVVKHSKLQTTFDEFSKENGKLQDELHDIENKNYKLKHEHEKMIQSGAEIMIALKRELGWSKAKIKNMEITVIQLSAMLTDGNRKHCADQSFEKHWENLVDEDKKTIRNAEKYLEKML